MLEPSHQQPNHIMAPPPAPPPAPPLMQHQQPPQVPPPPLMQQKQPPSPPPSLTRIYSEKIISLLSKKPSLRVTSDFNSDSGVFFHKVSCKLFDNLARLKLSFINNGKSEISDPHIMFSSQYLSFHYDPQRQDALINTSFDVGSMLHFNASHNVKAQHGEVSMFASPIPGYGLHLSSPVPFLGSPRATIRFPVGEVTLEERDEEDVQRTLSMKGILRGQILNGVCSANYVDEQLKLRYIYKDQLMSFIPTVSIPSNAVSFAFKRRLSESDKLSYWYKLDSNNWSAVYKHTYEKNFKFKAGYDSDVRLGWASIWIGGENGKAKTAPMKMKVQFMLQVPQDDIKSSMLMFRVKKRWDIL